MRHQKAVSAAMACVVYSLISEGYRAFSARQYPRLGPGVIRGYQKQCSSDDTREQSCFFITAPQIRI